MEKYLSPLRITIYVHDYEVSIGLPEHLEPFEHRIAGAVGIDRSFEDFIEALQDVVDEQACRFTTLQSKRPFEVRFAPEHRIEIGEGDQKVQVDVDDLRSIWVKLLHGVVTQEAVEWGPHVDGEFLLALLSMLPQVRPIQIQRRNAAEPEIAVELRHRRGATVPDAFAAGQPEHAWG